MTESDSPAEAAEAAEAQLASLVDEATALAGELAEADARRLRASVVRPLSALLRRPAGHAPTSPGPASAGPGTSGERLWALAQEATRLRARPQAPAELIEATAALQDLVCGRGDDHDTAARHAELRRLQAALPAAIMPAPDGPYLVTDARYVTDHLGEPVATTPTTALCRCGASALKPLCDGTHATTGFTSGKDPKRVPDHRETHVGQQVDVLDNRGICQHSGYCTDRLASVFHQRGEPFVTPSGGRMDEIVRAVRDCPSGALSFAIDQVEARDAVDRHGTREPAIEVSKDGPYRVTGAIPLVQEDGTAVPRDQGASLEHYALCRCGQSRNKPFCSGMHWYVGFRDPVPEADHRPSIFEWAGGLPALERMTRLFYEKHVPQDPLLAPLFASMSPDHPQRVAKWLGEVFCGPSRYSDEYGGYTRMISQHMGKGLTEEQRARWVKLLTLSAQEAGLPNDAEFRSAFGAYIEWGSRLAVENSQAGATPPPHMPVPHWDWHTAAGAPGSRVPAIAAPAAEPEAPPVLPSADEPVRFADHVKPLFRAMDRQSMTFVFDLWAHDDVSRHADAILRRLRAGTMPCDGPWPTERIDAFARWIDEGKQP
ncbi:CDGSH iron-sulfur domain-containing protein [Actinacidiphila paucisporea]|uniref:Truncated hemoglobin YjbI n=1 Tax=Actinacidiphila paucisporea TaxID=310782 RepID=A0A1M7M3Q1_9ACTN|nr:CDGSH iron-sulfur domain-containing protein [Actinacidiphila paucisporea]SHM85188.1 Truncated hemoglobin YjbI [Actinacidiphila paucisporea]